MRKVILILVCAGLVAVDGFSQVSGGQKGDLAGLQKYFSQTRGAVRRFTVADSIFRAYNEYDLVTSGWFARQAYRLADSAGTRVAAILGNHAMALTLAYEGDYAGSVEYSQHELDLSILERDTLAIIRAHINLGDNYIELGRFNMAYFHSTHAMEFALAARSMIDISIITHNLGRIHKNLGQFEQANKFLIRSDSISKTLNDLAAPMFTLRELGDICLMQKEYTCAAEKLHTALRMSHQFQTEVIRADLYLDLGKMYTLMGENREARLYLDSANRMAAELRNRFVAAKCLLWNGTLAAEEGNNEEAQKLMLKSYDAATALGARTLQIEALEQLAALTENSGDFENALLYYHRFEELKDSLYNRELPDQTLKYQLHFLREATDRELEEQQEHIQQQHLYRNLLIGGVVLLALMLYIVYRNNRRRVEINRLLLTHQEELEKRSKDLEDLNQMKDKFFSVISHDLRSPINSLAGVLNLMEKNGVTADELPMLTRELRLQFNYARNLITNLLNWAMLQMDKISLKREPLELNPIVEENFRLARSLSNKQVSLVNSVQPGMMVLADSNMISLVLRNLITNAMKFTEAGGTVLVAAQDEPDQVTVRVQDNGIGIPEEVQGKILGKNASYSTIGTANEKGTGLGLGLCREFVERNGGKIWLSSKEGEGTTFYFTLPKN